jgi:hypothetical protein
LEPVVSRRVKRAEVNRRLGKIERAFEASTRRLPGGVVLARLGDELAFDAAFGAAVLVPERREARLDTLYDLASLTKVMATTARPCCSSRKVASPSTRRSRPTCLRSRSAARRRSTSATS